MEVGDLPQAERVKQLFDSYRWMTNIWLDSAGHGRVVVAVRSDQWEFLLPQPDYSQMLDLTPFPRRERTSRGRPGSILSMFERPQLVGGDQRRSGHKSKKNEKTFVDRILEKLKGEGSQAEGDDKNGFIKYLEDLKKISK